VRVRLAGGLALTLASAGCSFTTRESGWSSQLEADGPCWSVRLDDGLDEGSTAELRDLYDCLNRQGALQALDGSMQALEGTGRGGLQPGTDLARLVNRLAELELDLVGLVSSAVELLEDPDRPVETVLQAAVEAIYGQAWSRLPAQEQRATSEALAEGLVVPGSILLGLAATRILDQGGEPLPLLAEIVEDPAVDDMICTAAGLVLSEDPTVRSLSERLPADLGEALARSRDASNDRWSGASGDSLRDLLVALLVSPGSDGQTVLHASTEPLLGILDDEYAVANLRQTLEQSREADSLTLLPAQLRHLSQVDRAGGSLAGQEDSALSSLLRLLDQANTEVVCTVDILVTDLRIDLGNLSVSLLSFLADQDPDAAADGVDLLGDVLGWGLSQTTLELIASTGACPVIDDQLVDDLQAIDRLGDPEVRELVVVLLGVFDDLRAGEQDRLPDLVDLVSIVHQRGAVPPLEELLADVGSTALAADLVEVVGLGLDPSALQVTACPDGSEPLRFAGMLGLARALLGDRLGGSALERLDPLLQELLGAEESWQLLGNLGTLAQAEDARLFELPALLFEGLDGQPTDSSRLQLAQVLADPTWTDPLLRLAESAALGSALRDPGSAATPGPLPWAAQLVIGGTLDAVLRTVDLVLGSLDGSRGDAPDAARGPPPPPLLP